MIKNEGDGNELQVLHEFCSSNAAKVPRLQELLFLSWRALLIGQVKEQNHGGVPVAKMV